jgi:hypothetical protein
MRSSFQFCAGPPQNCGGGLAQGGAAAGGGHGRSRRAGGAGRERGWGRAWGATLANCQSLRRQQPLASIFAHPSPFPCRRSCGGSLRGSGGRRRRRGGGGWRSRRAATRSACATCRTSGAPARRCKRCGLTAGQLRCYALDDFVKCCGAAPGMQTRSPVALCAVSNFACAARSLLCPSSARPL